MAETTFHVTLITPEATVLDTEAVLVIVPADDGQLGVMARHSPLITRLTPGGLLKLQTPQGNYQFTVQGGYAQMENNALTVLTDRATPLSAAQTAPAGTAA